MAEHLGNLTTRTYNKLKAKAEQLGDRASEELLEDLDGANRMRFVNTYISNKQTGEIADDHRRRCNEMLRRWTNG
jgi:hypothetical protein